MNLFKKKISESKADVLLIKKRDRRLLPHVPDSENIRTNLDRRGKATTNNQENNIYEFIKSIQAGTRYEANFLIEVLYDENGKKVKLEGQTINISTTGILISIDNMSDTHGMDQVSEFTLKFTVESGSLPEGFEMKYKIDARLVRSQFDDDANQLLLAFQFNETLTQYTTHRKNRHLLAISSLFLFLISLFIVLMRAESIIYFQFNIVLYLYSIAAAVFLLGRYLFGSFYRPIGINTDFEPGVTIIIPCFNEEEWISQTILSCMDQEYPLDKLEVIVVDDCSNDNSVARIKETVDLIHLEADRYMTKERLSYVVQEKNAGKRDALARGAKMAKHDLLVFVDSDSFLDPFAIRNLVQPFQDPKMGGVAGRTDVANTYTNTLTKMQSVRYYISFRINKAAEAYFDAVTCLSGPLACYRKDIVIEHLDEWLNQKFLGQKATFGDDRSLTNIVLRKHRTNYQDTAVCSTIVPNDYNVFLKQQMRWKRSWLRESMIAGSFIWKKEPFMSLFFYMGLAVPVLAPVIVAYNLVYVPIVYRVFPTTFLIGILMMALMMSFAQMFFRKSTTWLFGLIFVLYYEAVLLWQMPVAWVTFWKSTWGTRMTPEDIAEQEKKAQKKRKKSK